MGAYRSQPLIEKTSNDGEGNGLIYGVSEMQGWRVSMEDAWTCMPNLDESTAMFAVYDGHGGQEVAQYCSKKLASFIKDTEAYKNGDLKTSLNEAFLNIDKSILTDEVIKELKELAGDQDDEEEDEAAMLSEEAMLPIEELLKRMKQGKNEAAFEKIVASNGNGFGFGSDDEEENDDEESASPSKEKVNGDKEDSRSKTEMQRTDDKMDNEATESNAQAEEQKVMNDVQKEEKGKGKNAESEEQESKEEAEEETEEQGEDSEDEEVEGGEDSAEEEGDDEEEEEDSDDEDDDEVCVPESDEVGKDSGSTAIVALKRGDQLVVANVGDSRCVLCRGKKAVDMSVDHKPEDEGETARITKAGGKITGDGRVNGGLNLSRAIGDHNYKVNEDLSPHEQAITAVPDIKEETITKEDQFMIMACDGIWNIMTSQEAVDFVCEKLDQQRKNGSICLSKICEQVFDKCIAPDTSGDGSGCDNMTCIIILFGNGQITNAAGSRKRLDKETESEEKPKKRQKVDQ
eukprot:Seg205.16 transcript_id=Seg205.16/GoldUCD/mRNA.D3Y31 product="Protein phosphatase 1G" protein_id=Seg205.16/GoldUCD/D3Y31